MADNLDVTPGTGATVAADLVAGALHQRIKISLGADGSATDLAPGQVAKASSIPVVLASDQEAAFRGALTNRSGTITTGGSGQTLAAANAARNYLLIVNVSDTVLWINFGATTATGGSPSIPLQAASTNGGSDGGVFCMEGSFVSNEAVTIYGPTTGKAFVAKEG